MDQLLRVFDPYVVFAILLPIAAVLAAWGLQIACSSCSIDRPDFWQAMLAVIVICIANIVVRFWLQMTHSSGVEIETQLVASLLTTAVVLTLSLPTNPFSAMVVSVVHVMICGALYFALTLMGSALGPGLI